MISEHVLKCDLSKREEKLVGLSKPLDLSETRRSFVRAIDVRQFDICPNELKLSVKRGEERRGEETRKENKKYRP